MRECDVDSMSLGIRMRTCGSCRRRSECVGMSYRGETTHEIKNDRSEL